MGQTLSVLHLSVSTGKMLPHPKKVKTCCAPPPQVKKKCRPPLSPPPKKKTQNVLPGVDSNCLPPGPLLATPLLIFHELPPGVSLCMQQCRMHVHISQISNTSLHILVVHYGSTLVKSTFHITFRTIITANPTK